MKLIFYLLLTVLITCTPALADWSDTFRGTYQAKGIDTAVTEALGEGIAPAAIMELGITIKELPQPELIKALFCALVQPTTIYDAARINQVAESTVEEGYQLALAQCAEDMEEALNIAPSAQFPGVPPADQGRPAQASPWNFD
ncbi:MAG: hypothetical protein Kow0089_23740 [Desulfobulbaceae bacterium]